MEFWDNDALFLVPTIKKISHGALTLLSEKKVNVQNYTKKHQKSICFLEWLKNNCEQNLMQ